MITKTKTQAVSYVRMSSDVQTESPEQQRESNAKLAEEHNCEIVREYFDSGISGAETTKRKAFMQMLDDVETKGDFEVILAWDQDRFSRGDSLEVGELIAPLRRNGVKLITHAQGVIDWTDFAGRIVYSVQQEGKNQFLVDLSRNSLRGKLKAAKEGRLCSSHPYGFDRLVFDEKGEEKMRVHYGVKFSKPKTWVSKLSVSTEPEPVEIVKWIYETYASTDRSIGSLASELNDQKKLSPKGVRWNATAISSILRNAVYAGDFVFGSRSYGKFHQIGNEGSIEKAKGTERTKEPAVVIQDNHEALIDRQTFDKVQAKLESRRSKRQRPKHGGYLLTGVLQCGHCGSRLYRHGSGKKASYQCKGGAKGICQHYGIPARLIEPFVVDLLQQQFTEPKALKRLRQEIIKQLKRNTKETPSSLRSIKQKISGLNRKIKKGTEALLMASPEDMIDASTLLGEWRNERDALEYQVQEIKNPGGDDPDEIADRAIEKVHELTKNIGCTEVSSAREAVKSVIDTITFWWQDSTQPNKPRQLAKGLVKLNRGATLTSVLSAAK